MLPIWVGSAEASSIAAEIHQQRPARPNSHDFAARLIEGLEGELLRVVVTEIRDGTFYADPRARRRTASGSRSTRARATPSPPRCAQALPSWCASRFSRRRAKPRRRTTTADPSRGARRPGTRRQLASPSSDSRREIARSLRIRRPRTAVRRPRRCAARARTAPRAREIAPLRRAGSVDSGARRCQDASRAVVLARRRLTPTEGSDTPMGCSDTTDRLRREELAWELVEVFDELRIEQINEVLAKNVPLETLEFFSAYADEFADSNAIAGRLAQAPAEPAPARLSAARARRAPDRRLDAAAWTREAAGRPAREVRSPGAPPLPVGPYSPGGGRTAVCSSSPVRSRSTRPPRSWSPARSRPRPSG